MHRIVVGFFIRDREEQLVLDDRAAEIYAEVLVFEWIGNNGVAFELVAGQVVIVVQVKRRAVEFIRAGLGDDVDRATGELAVLHVQRCKFNGGRCDGVERDGKGEARRGSGTFVQAVTVIGDRTVDGECIGAGGAAQAVNAGSGAAVGASNADTRVDTNDVTNLARDARHRLKVFQRERAAGANRQVNRRDLRRQHDDFFNRSIGCGQRNVKGSGARQVGVDIRDQCRFVLGGIHAQRKRSAHTQAAYGKGAVGVGGGGTTRAGSRIGDGDDFTRRRAAVRSRYGTADHGCNLLCV